MLTMPENNVAAFTLYKFYMDGKKGNRFDEKSPFEVFRPSKIRTFISMMEGSKSISFKLAANLIKQGVKLRSSKKTLNSYVNDAIGFRMKPEQVLYYSDNCFGTADAICFKDGYLRIHDLKTGTTKASMNQLFIYDALFCLEYDIRPKDIKIENRIYQNDEIVVAEPSVEEIAPIMSKIITFDKIINKLKTEE